MAGVLAVTGRMGDGLTLGYREVTTTVVSPLGPAGTTFRGHEFHYSSLDDPGNDLVVSSRFGTTRAGFASRAMAASYVHHHPGGDTRVVAAFVDACRRRAQ